MQEPSSKDVLAILDERVPTSFYWQLTLLATLGGFLFGYDTSNIGSALNFVPYHLVGFAEGYLVAGASLGAAVGAILAGPLTDRFGRKALLVTDAGVYAAGAILSAVTLDGAVLMFARTLIGLAIGADSAIATAYISEYAPRNRRGSLSLLQQWMITVGILFAYIVALVIFLALPGSAATVDWRLILGLGAVPALLGLGLRTELPESPRWLMLKGRYDQAKTSLPPRRGCVDRRYRGHCGAPGRSAAPGANSAWWRLDSGRKESAVRSLYLLCVPADNWYQRSILLWSSPVGFTLRWATCLQAGGNHGGD